MVENKIIKIGGACLTSAEHFQTIKQRLVASPPKLLMVSALGKTTAQLKQCVEHAAKGLAYQPILQALSQLHCQLAKSILTDSDSYIATFDQDMVEAAERDDDTIRSIRVTGLRVSSAAN